MATLPYTPEPDEKLVPTMIYTQQRLIWGQLLTKEVIRVSTWLQTEMAPNYLNMFEAQVLFSGAQNPIQPLKYPDLFVETNQIIAYHILPPADEGPYYDSDTPNRKMEPVTAVVGIYQFDCAIRLTEQSNLKNYLGVQKGDFLPVYDATMSSPILTSIKGIKTPYVLIRQGAAFFSKRS